MNFIFPFNWECHHPNLTFTPSFFRGVGSTTNQKNLVYGPFVKFSHEIMERGPWFYSTVATKDNVSCGVMMSALKKGAGQALVSGASGRD